MRCAAATTTAAFLIRQPTYSCSTVQAVREVEPGVRVGKILIQRDEEHPEKIAKLFYSKLPPEIKDLYVLLCDPMLATGGSAVKALEVLVEQYSVDPKKIIFGMS